TVRWCWPRRCTPGLRSSPSGRACRSCRWALPAPTTPCRVARRSSGPPRCSWWSGSRSGRRCSRDGCRVGWSRSSPRSCGSRCRWCSTRRSGWRDDRRSRGLFSQNHSTGT
ncbi:uncharacterized protein METZ01_LOCUS452890, partial [marine metagenome]